MSFPSGSRVVLRRAHAGIPAGSLGTVVSSAPASSVVDFDIDPSRSIMVPNVWLASAGERAAKAKQAAWFTTRGGGAAKAPEAQEVLWYTPTVSPPGVGTDANFVPVTATPNLLSLLLQNAEVALRGVATSGCWIGSLEFPVTGGPANLTVDVRGVAEQPDGAKTSIFIVLGAVLKSIAFDGARSGDFTETYAATIGAEPVQTLTIILLAERPPGSATDLIVGVDSIDVSKS